MARHADDGGQWLPCILIIGEAALVADLITQLMFKHLERKLAAYMVTRKASPFCEGWIGAPQAELGRFGLLESLSGARVGC